MFLLLKTAQRIAPNAQILLLVPNVMILITFRAMAHVIEIALIVNFLMKPLLGAVSLALITVEHVKITASVLTAKMDFGYLINNVRILARMELSRIQFQGFKCARIALTIVTCAIVKITALNVIQGILFSLMVHVIVPVLIIIFKILISQQVVNRVLQIV